MEAAPRSAPPREREGDLAPLIDGLLDRVNQQGAKETGFTPRNIPVEAKNLLIRQIRPGNVRDVAVGRGARQRRGGDLPRPDGLAIAPEGRTAQMFLGG